MMSISYSDYLNLDYEIYNKSACTSIRIIVFYIKPVAMVRYILKKFRDSYIMKNIYGVLRNRCPRCPFYGAIVAP